MTPTHAPIPNAEVRLRLNYLASLAEQAQSLCETAAGRLHRRGDSAAASVEAVMLLAGQILMLGELVSAEARALAVDLADDDRALFLSVALPEEVNAAD